MTQGVYSLYGTRRFAKTLIPVNLGSIQPVRDRVHKTGHVCLFYTISLHNQLIGFHLLALNFWQCLRSLAGCRRMNPREVPLIITTVTVAAVELGLNFVLLTLVPFFCYGCRCHRSGCFCCCVLSLRYCLHVHY